ncbi:MAG: Omp28 family outer membrane lipoprotein [Bacteroidetes bacterium]|nr:Omp28 family outer membrane lipoprotein [Bacteroidota bacterium]
MKKIIFPALLIAGAIAIYSCDKIDGPTREEDNSGVVLGENALLIDGDTLSFDTLAYSAQKHVLAEDYTGHLCGTCPPAGVTLNDSLKAQFGDQLVVISIHAGQFADVCPTALDCPSAAPTGAFTADYRTALGNSWNTKFGITANPIGMIDRVGYPTSHKKVYTAWKNAVQTELAVAPVAKMRMKTTYDATSREVRAAVQGQLVQEYNGTLKLQMVVVEDSIVDWQQWYAHNPQLVSDYVHHDVLRGSFNGDFGDTLSTGAPIANSTKFIKGYFTSLAANWNADKCHVIAFVYDADTYQVVEVVQAKVGE